MMKIIVHSGRAHRDDFMAVSILLASLVGPVQVFRRDPTSAELADPGTYVVDVGMDYAPQRHNFDHHHDPSLPCAFHLVMQHLGLHDDALQLFGWYPFMNMLDVGGPHKTAEYLGIDAEILFASASPIDGYVLGKFSELVCLGTEDLFYGFMKEMGQNLLLLIEEKKARLIRLKNEVQIFPLKQFRVVVSHIAENPKLAMELYLREMGDDKIAISITPSGRGPGWELLRLGENPWVDFRAIAGSPQICFVHANGHVATTHALLPLPEVLDLAARSVRSG